MKAWVAFWLSLTMFGKEVDKDITVLQPDLRKLKIFLPILLVHIMEKKSICSTWYGQNTTNLKFLNSQLNEVSL